MQVLGPFGGDSSDFAVVMRLLIHQALCSVVECFLEAVFHEADYKKLFIMLATRVLMAFNR